MKTAFVVASSAAPRFFSLFARPPDLFLFEANEDEDISDDFDRVFDCDADIVC